MKLDDDQNKIVNHQEGPALVLAGAGSGKTHSVVQRVITRMNNGVGAQNILLLTFTNKACAEIKARIRDTGQELPTISTFHSFGYTLIREYPKEMGLRADPSILDAKDSRALLRELIVADRIVTDDLRPALHILSLLSNEVLDPNNENDQFKIVRFIIDHDFSADIACGLLGVYREYMKLKITDNILDYSDLICLPVRALQKHADLRGKIQNRYLDITIDEAQDSNDMQYQLLKQVAGNNTVVLVGDIDQSLYSWNGARPENITRFQKEYDAKIFYLERNYRSRPIIVDSATALIRNNPDRFDNNPYSARKSSHEKILYFSYDRESFMAEQVAIDVETDLNTGKSPNDIAVLYRVNRMSKSIEPALIQRKIPYHIQKGTALLERVEVKMLLAAGRLVINSRDIQALGRLSALIPGLGPKKVRDLADASRRSGTEIWDNLDVLTGQCRKIMEALKISFDNLKQNGPGFLLSWALNETIFKQWMTTEAEKYARTCTVGEDRETVTNRILVAKINNLHHLKTTIDARLLENHDYSIEDQWAEVIMDLLPKPPDESGKKEAVTLSTIHSAKGREWKKVHVVGFSDGLLPLRNSSTDQIDNLSEERCLTYVAMTRAQDLLCLHHCDSAIVNGKIQQFKPSRFLNEFGNEQNLEKR